MYNIVGNINQNSKLREDIQKLLNAFEPAKNQIDVSSAALTLVDISEPDIPPTVVAGSTVNSTFSIDCEVSVVANTTSVARVIGGSGEKEFEREYSPAMQNSSLTVEADCILAINANGYDLLEFNLLDKKLTVDTPTGCALKSITLEC